MRKVIIIDLDRTLIDTDRLISRRNKVLKEFGISKRLSHLAYKKTSKKVGFYHPINHVNYLTKKSKTRKLIFKKLDQLFLKPKEHNYSGVFEFLQKLSAKYHLILLSHGYKKFLMTKIGQAKIKPFFKKIITTEQDGKRNDLEHLAKKYGEDMLLLDDSIKVVTTARSIGMKSIKVKKSRKDEIYYRKLLKRITDIMKK